MSQRNTTTIYICTFGVAAFFETISSGAAWTAQLTFDVIVKNEVVGNISLETKTQPTEVGTRDGITGQFVSTKNEWKNFLGVDHLNWFQVVTQDFYPPIPLDSTLTLQVPYIDPPKTGYLSGWHDEEPWYWDEYTPMTKYNIPEEEVPIPWASDSQLTAQTENNGQILKFSDQPIDYLNTNQLKFETFLIGDFGDKTYDFLTGFSWSISLAKGTSNITDIKQGATFTNQYANLI